MKATVLAESSYKLSFFIVICALQRCLWKVTRQVSLSFLLFNIFFYHFASPVFPFILILSCTVLFKRAQIIPEPFHYLQVRIFLFIPIIMISALWYLLFPSGIREQVSHRTFPFSFTFLSTALSNQISSIFFFNNHLLCDKETGLANLYKPLIIHLTQHFQK